MLIKSPTEQDKKLVLLISFQMSVNKISHTKWMHDTFLGGQGHLSKSVRPAGWQTGYTRICKLLKVKL